MTIGRNRTLEFVVILSSYLAAANVSNCRMTDKTRLERRRQMSLMVCVLVDGDLI